MERSERITNAFSTFFALSQSIVGNEANYQAILHNSLISEFGEGVYREYRDKSLGRGAIDVVMCDNYNQGITAAFEIKGGAYNVRNALNDTFTEDGYCKDMDRLKKLSLNGTQAWMVCIDATELGRSMTWKKLQGAIDHIKQRQIGFAYYAQGEDKFLIVHPDGQRNSYPLKDMQNHGVAYDAIRDQIMSSTIFEKLISSRESFQKEADIVSYVYQKLVEAGCTQRQISLETYFGFAPGQGMQQRPDICVYEPKISGHFNLYPNGNASKSYDPLKLESLRCIIEVKGGVPLAKGDGVVIKAYKADLTKIDEWKRVIDDQKPKLQVNAPDIDYMLLAVDVRPRGIQQNILEELAGNAMSKGISFRYLHTPI